MEYHNEKIVTKLGLTYDMTPEKMSKAIQILEGIVAEQIEKGHINDSYAIGFNSFGDFSLGIVFVYRIISGQDILGVQTEVNKDILESFTAHKVEMAFPTQTVLHKQLGEVFG